MPIYEYNCIDCDIEFEQHLNTSEAKEFANYFPCPKCKKDANKMSVYSVNASFGGKPGNSGFHDVDYPVLDKAVGRSSAKKWEKIHRDQAERDKIRRETGSTALTDTGAGYAPVSSEALNTRTEAFTKLKASKPE